MDNKENILKLAKDIMGWDIRKSLGQLSCDWDPYYNIEDAWQLIEKLRPKNFIELCCPDRCWSCHIECLDSCEMFAHGLDKVASVAICKACLSWLEDKK